MDDDTVEAFFEEAFREMKLSRVVHPGTTMYVVLDPKTRHLRGSISQRSGSVYYAYPLFQGIDNPGIRVHSLGTAVALLLVTADSRFREGEDWIYDKQLETHIPRFQKEEHEEET